MNALREERPWLINLRRFYRRKGINIGLEIFFFFFVFFDMFGTKQRMKGRFELRNVGSLMLPTNNVCLRVILQLLQILLYSPYKLMC